MSFRRLLLKAENCAPYEKVFTKRQKFWKNKEKSVLANLFVDSTTATDVSTQILCFKGRGSEMSSKWLRFSGGLCWAELGIDFDVEVLSTIYCEETLRESGQISGMSKPMIW